MKKILFLLLTAITLTAFTSCSKDDGGGSTPETLKGTTWATTITEGNAKGDYTFIFAESTVEVKNKKTVNNVVEYDNTETHNYTRAGDKVSIIFSEVTVVCTISGNKMSFQVPSGGTITLTKK